MGRRQYLRGKSPGLIEVILGERACANDAVDISGAKAPASLKSVPTGGGKSVIIANISGAKAPASLKFGVR